MRKGTIWTFMASLLIITVSMSVAVAGQAVDVEYYDFSSDADQSLPFSSPISRNGLR